MDPSRFPECVRFAPWVGSAFFDQSRRLLILGESHYSDDEPPRTFTQTLVDEYVKGWNHRFWTQIGQAVTGKPGWSIDRPEFWGKVAFYNYVQVIAAERAGQAPTHEMFAQSEAAFFEVLDLLKPAHVLAMGYRLWQEMPPLEDEALSLTVDGKSHPYGFYPRGWGCVAAMPIKHPSWGFSPQSWHLVIRAFLALNRAPDDALVSTAMPANLALGEAKGT